VGATEDHVTVVSLLRLVPRDGAADELARRFGALEIFEHSRRSGGFLGGKLLRPADDEAFVVLAEWETSADYQRWLDNPVRAELGSELEPLLDADVSSGQLYEEVRWPTG
jgi:heme-degrading monooxygenase HmoA